MLAYPKFKLTSPEIRGLLEEELLPFVETVRETPVKVTIGHDPDDAKFIECALAASVPYVVSGDTDLLAMRRVQSVKIVTVSAFLNLLEPYR